MKALLMKWLGLCNPAPIVMKDSQALINDGFAVFEKAQAKVAKGIAKADEELAKVEDQQTDLTNKYLDERNALFAKEADIVKGQMKAERLKEKLDELLGE